MERFVPRLAWRFRVNFSPICQRRARKLHGLNTNLLMPLQINRYSAILQRLLGRFQHFYNSQPIPTIGKRCSTLLDTIDEVTAFALKGLAELERRYYQIPRSNAELKLGKRFGGRQEIVQIGDAFIIELYLGIQAYVIIDEHLLASHQ